MDEEGARIGSRPDGGGVDLISTLPDALLLQVLERLGSDEAAARTSILSCRWRFVSARRPHMVAFALPVPEVPFPYEGDDLISALPEDLLLKVIGGLDSVRAAARTGLVSRRWRGLWTRLPKVTVTLHDVPFGSLEAALRRATRPGVCHYHLDIRIPGQDDRVDSSSASSLLSAAAALSPVELLFTLPSDLLFTVPMNLEVFSMDLSQPSFRRTTSIELHARDLHLSPRQGSWGWFPLLERLSLSGCQVQLAAFIPCCPRPRLGNITIRSASLEELVVEHRNSWTGRSRIRVEVPALKQLTMSFHAHTHVGVSILAPMVEKVSWRCPYTRLIYGLGLWGLIEVGLNTSESRRQTDSPEDACLQLPSVHVLSLNMCAQDTRRYPNAELNFATEIEKHMVTNFSGLDLLLTTKGHVFGAFVLRLLGMHRIRTAIRSLRIVLLVSEVKDACTPNCLCDETNDYRAQSISLASLEKLKIEGVKGEDHEFDFLKVIFRCAPMLKTVSVKLSDGVTPTVDWCTKINNILMAYPVVECTVDLGPESTNNNQSCAST